MRVAHRVRTFGFRSFAYCMVIEVVCQALSLVIAMEAAGLGVGVMGLASLISSAREAKEMYDSYRSFEFETRPVAAQRDAARVLLQQWCENVGYGQSRLKDDHHKILDEPRVLKVVDQIFQCLQDIDADTDSKQTDPSPSSREESRQARGPPIGLAGHVQMDKSQKPKSRRTKLAWAFQDKKKSFDQTQNVAALLHSLYELVPPAGSDGTRDSHESLSTVNPLRKGAREIETVSSILQRIEMALEKAQDLDDKRSSDDFKSELPRWLGTTWTPAMYDNFVERRLDGTCEWIFDRPEYVHWENGDAADTNVLWIHGPAGYGKTILCAKLIERLKSRDSPLAYYFFSSDSDSRADPFAIVRSWAYQVIAQNQQAFELARGRWEATNRRPSSQADVKELFEVIVRNIRSCIFVVDGLDECAGIGCDWKADYRTTLAGFFTYLKQATSNTRSRLIVVSRDEREIREGLNGPNSGSYWNLTACPILPANVKPDATRFAQSIVDLKLGNKTEAQREQLAHQMVDHFESMFLCMRALEGHLREGKSPAQLQRTIGQAPTELYDLYDRNWRKIAALPETDRSRALAILRWATFALRPLTVLEITGILVLVDEECDELLDKELPDAIDQSYIRSEILDLCGSLLETRGSGSDLASLTIHLTHFSVRQYLLSHALVPAGQLLANERLRRSNEATENNIIAMTCLRYLNLDQVLNKTESRYRTQVIQAFREYAITSWCQHFKRDADNALQVIKCVNSFFHLRNASWESWRRHADEIFCDKMLNYQGQIHSGNPLFYASFLGLMVTVTYLIEYSGLDVNHIDSSNRTALLAASSKGWISGVIYLLKSGAHINMASKEGRTPIYVAASNGHSKTVTCLLDKGADLTVANNGGWTPLNSASDSGHTEVVKLLLEKGADLTRS
ncbi:hypothetical protein V493_00457 [Pseudogymnoascus sp. VKM F-4281 (FW-2241)]|nr:hypothetical protein V493_00457 [Pseudogymnoascus sp. VKM F-4281 (FW-2241)]